MSNQVTKNYSALFNGVSQQAPQLRLDSQCEEQINFISDPADGLRRRPGSEVVDTVSMALIPRQSGIVHPIPASGGYGPYVMFLLEGETEPIEIYDVATFTSQTITYNSADAKTYAGSQVSSSDVDYRVLTVADTTFLVNRQYTPAMDSTTLAESRDARDLNDAAYGWNTSPADSDEYYLHGAASTTTDPAIDRPADINIDGTFLTEGTVGSLAVGEYAWDDNDTLGFDTLYVRTPTDADPSGLTTVEGLYDEAWIYVWVKTGYDSPSTWEGTIDGSALSITADTDTNTFASAIKTGIDNLTLDYVVEYVGNTSKSSILRVRKVTNDLSVDFQMSNTGGSGSTAVEIIPGRVSKFSDLPPIGEDGDVVLIEGEDGVSAGGRYYVRWQDSTQTWTETMAPLQDTTFDATTMPIQIVRNSSGDFDVDVISWSARQVGDDDTIPQPSFIGNRINDIFFVQNRLGLISDDSVILSRSDDFYNFWGATATDILDDDPIDIAVQNAETTELVWASAFQKAVVLFGLNNQFSLSSTDQGPMTPSTVVVDPTTRYRVSDKCRPQSQGDNIYFVTPIGGAYKVREYFVQPDTILTEAADITAHIPSYIDKEIVQIVPVPNENMLLFISAYQNSTSTNVQPIWVYQYLWEGDQKSQSSWSRWSGFEATGAVSFSDSEVFLLNSDRAYDFSQFPTDHISDEMRLEKLSLRPNNLDDMSTRLPYLDHLTEATYQSDDGTYLTFRVDCYIPGTTGQSVDWSLIRKVDRVAHAGILVSHAVGQSDIKFLKAPIVANIDPNETTPLDNVGGNGPFWVGENMTAEYTLSEVYLRDGDGPVLQGDLRLINMLMALDDVGQVKVTVESKGRGSSDDVTIDLVDLPMWHDTDYDTGEDYATDEKRKAWLYGDARDLTIKISSVGGHPLTIHNLSILTDYTNKTRIR